MSAADRALARRRANRAESREHLQHNCSCGHARFQHALRVDPRLGSITTGPNYGRYSCVECDCPMFVRSQGIL